MAEIAARAGVSQGTVSLSLANHPRIPSATRAKIRAIADRLGYRPNPYVSALMRQRRLGLPEGGAPLVALVNRFATEDGWRNNLSHTVREMHAGAIAQADRRGYRTEEFWLHQEGMSADRFSRMLHARGIHGVLLSPPPVGQAPLELRWELFAVVNLSVPLPSLTVTTVCNDHFFSVLQIARHCRQLGYRRPGLLLLDHHRERFQCRWDGGLAAGCMLEPELSPTATLTIPNWETLEPIASWLERERPDVVVSPSAELLIPYLRRLGWRVPTDIGLASLACPTRRHRCSGIFQNGELIGATALDVLLGQVERNERGLPEQAQTIMVQGVWNDGSTLRRRGRGAKRGLPVGS